MGAVRGAGPRMRIENNVYQHSSHTPLTIKVSARARFYRHMTRLLRR